jgi:imidazolonepropionase-like amidohydrolase
MPERGVKTDLSFLRESMSPADFAKLEAANKDDAKAHEFWSIQARNLAKLNAAGIKIVVGTDGNTPYAPHIEMEDMVAAGMTPMQVIVAATRNGAQFLRLTDVGTIEANKSADLLVLDANPLDNITNTRKINSVYFRGAKIDRAAFRVNTTN